MANEPTYRVELPPCSTVTGKAYATGLLIHAPDNMIGPVAPQAADPIEGTIEATIAQSNKLIAGIPGRGSTFCGWANLPTELKLKVLDTILIGPRARGVQAYTHNYYTERCLVPLLQTSKQMQELAWRSYYKHGIILSRLHDSMIQSMQYPQHTVASFIRTVELHVELPDLFGAWDLWSPSQYEYSAWGQFLHLVRPIKGDYKTMGMSDWQLSFTSLESLRVALTVVDPINRMGRCLQGAEDWTELFDYVTVHLRLSFLSVVVKGLECGESGIGACPHECAKKIETALQEFIVHKKD